MMLPVLLAGCAHAPTYAETAATARAMGCWPYTYPTPRAVTVTPVGALTATPFGTAAPAARTATALPTTTPYPRCRPGPGETPRPWPTPVPPPQPYPTAVAAPWQSGSDLETVMHLPGTVDSIDLAVHPIDGWPVVAATQRSWGSPIRAYVRVYNPHSQTWGLAQQLDYGESSLGTDRFGTITVGITGDNTIYAVWGASDATEDTVSRIWASQSSDFGATWSRPTPIAERCWRVVDLATNAAGTVVVLADCLHGTVSAYEGRATVIVHRPGGQWKAAEHLDAPGWSGSIALVDAGDGVHIVVLTAALTEPAARTLFLSQTRLADEQHWTTARLPFTLPPDTALEHPNGSAAIHIQNAVYARTGTDDTHHDTVTFTWATADRAALFALTVRDSGEHWGAIEPLRYQAGRPDHAGVMPFVAPAYDTVTDHLFALWPCCGATLYDAGAATHYASWSVPGSGIWTHSDAPIITGARAADATVTAQARNSRTLWLAWIEQGQQVAVRSLDLATLIPTPAVGDTALRRLP